jgi:hypothetical protein
MCVNEIARRQELQRKEQDVSLAKWIRETANIAFADPVELEGGDGKPRKFRDIPIQLRKCISNIYWIKDGQRQYELASKTKGLDTLARALGYIQTSVHLQNINLELTQEDIGDIFNLLKAIRERGVLRARLPRFIDHSLI